MRDAHRTKLGLLVCTLLAVVALRYIWLTPQQAAAWVVQASYWMLAAVMLWALVVLGRWWRERRTRLVDLRWQATPLLVIAGLTLLLQVHEPHLLKVNYDENVLMGISRTMHYEHKAAWPGGAHLLFGTVTPTSLMPDKRPVFFPFVLSFVHTLTGYRVANVFLLNGVLAGVLLLGLYRLGKHYHASDGGLLLAALIAGVPLVAQNATGGGFDLLNTTLIVLLALGVRAYLDAPTGRRLEAITLLSICVANTRYESVLYATAPVVAFAAVWWRDRKPPELPWLIVVAPIGLLPALLSNAVFNSSDTFFQAKEAAFWAWNYIPHNLAHAVYYLFDMAPGGTNSVWLAALGMLSMAAALLVVRRRAFTKEGLPAETWALVIVGGVIATNVAVALGLRWGEWDDPLVSRFSLPFWVLLAWVVLEVVRHLEEAHKWSVAKPLTYASLAIVVLFALPDASQARATHKLKAGTALAWALDFLKQHDPDRTVLVLANSSVPYINEGYAAMPLDKSLVQFRKYAATLHHGLYSEVLIVLEERRDRKTGAWVSDVKHEELVMRASLEQLSRITLDPFYRMTIFRVLKTEDPPATLPWPGPDENNQNYERRVYELLP